MRNGNLPLPLLPPGWIIPETVGMGVPTGPDRFLARLRRRGWKISTPSATTFDTSDLLFVDIEKDAPSLSSLPDLIQAARARHLPVLVNGPASLIPEFEAGSDFRVTPLHGDRLQRWWGPERMDEELVRNLPDRLITRVTIGLRWAMVETEESVGLAAMPLLHSGEDANAANAATDTLEGRSLALAARGLRGPGGIARTIACAAVNAGIGEPENGIERDGLLPDDAPQEGHTVIIGRFPQLAAKRPGAFVLEKNPGPDDLPAEAACFVIPGAAELVCTASAWVNGTLPPLLRLAEDCQVTLVGPGTPLSTELHSYGIRRLAGFVVEEREQVRAVIADGRGVKAFKHFGRQVLITDT